MKFQGKKLWSFRLKPLSSTPRCVVGTRAGIAGARVGTVHGKTCGKFAQHTEMSASRMSATLTKCRCTPVMPATILQCKCELQMLILITSSAKMDWFWKGTAHGFVCMLCYHENKNFRAYNGNIQSINQNSTKLKACRHVKMGLVKNCITEYTRRQNFPLICDFQPPPCLCKACKSNVRAVFDKWKRKLFNTNPKKCSYD